MVGVGIRDTHSTHTRGVTAMGRGLYTHAEWCKRYGRMRDIAQRICDMRNERARELCREAGLDAGLLGIHPHNAMVSFNAGKPWREVNYSKCRACIRMMDRQYEGFRILERWDKRVR